MGKLETLYVNRMNAKNAAEREKRVAIVKKRETTIEMTRKFFDQISFLNKYGFKWEILISRNECTDVYIVNKTIATSPFERIIVSEINGEVKGKWAECILGHGRYVEGEDKNGWFSPEQLIIALSK